MKSLTLDVFSFSFGVVFLMTYFSPSPQMSGLQQQLLLVDQLRREAAIKRINVGQAVEDLKVLDTDDDLDQDIL